MIQSRRKNINLARNGVRRDPFDLILIVTEGEKTEPLYFKDLRSKEKLSSTNVEITGDCGSDPVSVVKHAIKLYEESVAEKNQSKLFDIAFCIVDRDKHPNFYPALQMIDEYNKKSNKMILIPIKSYPSFEYWYLCHLTYTRAPFVETQRKSSGDLCYDLLQQHWKEKLEGSYGKGKDKVYSIFDGKKLLDTAMIHAERALKDADSTAENNPSTEAHFLVSYLLNVKEVGLQVKSVLDPIFEFSITVERYLPINDNFEKKLGKLQSFLDSINKEYEPQLATLLSNSNKLTKVNIFRIKFMRQYLNELQNRLILGMEEILDEQINEEEQKKCANS
ncbi:RloB family protein [Acinetobacter sp. ANC 4178]|uniref:RloB family protein n=1 Tax=Acinetobacter sp. ANC 4178 TaxID=2529839 RepID=UPI0013F16303|nr:RloB family protein [Acinetobacter sp. ANC 4178]